MAAPRRQALLSDMLKTDAPVREVRGDLFEIGAGMSLAHCVSADLAMGRGIAPLFKRKFGHVDELKEQRVAPGGVAVLRVDDDQTIYYLVTKQFYWNKPTLSSVRGALVAMREHAQRNSVATIYMPRIGSGLDALPWDQVRGILDEVFADGTIRIVVCVL